MLSVGQNLQIEPISEEKLDTFHAEVLHFDEHTNQFTIGHPIEQVRMNQDELNENMLFNVLLIEEDGEVYQFESKLISKDSHHYFLKLQLPDQFKRVQRRAYVRVDINVKTIVHLDKDYETKTKDLSGGGMSITLPKEVSLKVDDSLNTSLYLTNGDQVTEVKTNNKIVRLEEKDNLLYVYLQFDEIDEADRTKIVQYCFKEQLEEYRKQR